MKNILNKEDLKQIKFIIQRIENAPKLAEEETMKIMGKPNHSYELGFLKGYVNILALELEAMFNKK